MDLEPNPQTMILSQMCVACLRLNAYTIIIDMLTIELIISNLYVCMYVCMYVIDRLQGSCGVWDIPKVLRGGAE